MITNEKTVALSHVALTRAELEVSKLVRDGSSNGEIGRLLGISRHTVESHMKHIFVKLGIGSRVQLAVLVARRDDAA